MVTTDDGGGGVAEDAEFAADVHDPRTDGAAKDGGKQTQCGCRGVGQVRGWCRGVHRAGEKHR